MRHLNEIVRERNQYSRDAMEAWQDFINLKGRMDTELSKVTKRNNFLVEELESWKQQVTHLGTRCNDCINEVHSFSNFKHLLSSSPKRLKISKLRLNPINAKTAALQLSSINKRMTLLVSQFVFQVPRNSVMTHSRHWYCNKRLQRNWSAKESGTNEIFRPCNIRTRLSYDRETKPKEW